MKAPYALVSLSLLILAANVRADRIAELTPRQQFLQAQLVVVGKVVSLDGDLEKVNGVGYRVANVRITEGLVGAKGLTNLRVGFIPLPNVAPNMRYFRQQVNLAVDQECCFFLMKHSQADFYMFVPAGYPIVKSQPNYDADLKTIKQLAAIFAEPLAALKAKESVDRQRAACMLIQHYRTPRAVSNMVKLESIPAEESKLILQALAEIDSAKTNREEILSLRDCFAMLGLNERDGWKLPPPQQGKQYDEVFSTAAKVWLNANAERYRIQRYVPDTSVPK